jgi:hypothetical protein
VTDDISTWYINTAISYNYNTELWAGSVVGIASGYELDGPEIESRWGRDFPYLSTPALGPTQPPVLYNGYQVFPGGKKQTRRKADPLPTSSTVGKKGSYSLYRASVPVQGCSLPLPYNTYRITQTLKEGRTHPQGLRIEDPKYEIAS